MLQAFPSVSVCDSAEMRPGKDRQSNSRAGFFFFFLPLLSNTRKACLLDGLCSCYFTTTALNSIRQTFLEHYLLVRLEESLFLLGTLFESPLIIEGRGSMQVIHTKLSILLSGNRLMR